MVVEINDGFHYSIENLFFFVYDPFGIVRNAEAMKKSYRRNRQTGFDKNVELFIVQPLVL